MLLDGLEGRIAMRPEEVELLREVCRESKSHLEIGTLWGGSAVLAAMAGPRVVTIDPMVGGYWENGDPGVELHIPTADAILSNFLSFNVAHKISVVKASSDPWPLPTDLMFDTALIDGDHSKEGCARDLRAVSRITRYDIMIHDYRDDSHEGVREAVDEFGGAWKKVDVVGTMALFRRVTW